MRSIASVKFGLVTSIAGLAAALIVSPAAIGATGAPGHSGTPASPASSSTARPGPARAGGLAALAKLRREAAARHQSAGAITGTVRGLLGAPVTGACVTAVGASGTRAGGTSAAGRFTISGLRPGLYKLEYRDCAAPGRYFTQWSGGAHLAAAASQVMITGGQVTTAAPVTLRPTRPSALLNAQTPQWLKAGTQASAAAATAAHGFISGLVTDQKGHPLKGICVYALPHNNFNRFYLTRTAKTGSYRTQRLPLGRYLIAFVPGCGNSGNWLLQFYRNTTNEAHAKLVRVAAGKTTAHINARLRPGGEIKGTVRSKSGTRLSGICVLLTDRHGNVLDEVATGHGSYRLPGLPSGAYGVQFLPGCGNSGNYAAQQWKDKPLGAKPTLIHVSAGKIVSGISAVLQPGGQISGTVTLGTSSGPALAGICVFATGDGAVAAIQVMGATDASGNYVVKGLATGSYQVEFVPGCNNNGNYLSADYPASVSATAGQVTANINQILQPGAAAAGLVTSKSSGQPLKDICVQASDDNGDFGFAITGPDGSYLIDQLPTSAYTIQFIPGCGSTGSYAPQFYNDQPNGAGAAQVALTQGSTSSALDAAMLPGATVTGRITSAAGKPLNGVCITAFTPGWLATVGAFAGQGSAQVANGKYRMDNLAPGQYEMTFADCLATRFADQTYKDQPGSGSGQVISVNGRHVTSGINAVMQPSGTISGLVTNPAHKRAWNICAIAANLRNGTQTESVFPTISGRYIISGLAAGRYTVEFSACAGQNYANSWYRKATSQAAAARVTVTARHTTAGINGVMSTGGKITGHVTDGVTNKPATGVCIAAFTANFASLELGFTNAAGNYTITGLNTGSYQVEFSPCAPGGDNLAEVSWPGLVRIKAGQTRSSLNVTLNQGGSLAGQVSGGSPVTGQAGICIDLVPVDPADPGTEAITGPGGAYTATNLLPGSYLVFFGDPACFYGPYDQASQWYQNTPSEAAATPVTVTAGSTTPGINAALGTDGQITGKVTGPAHAGLTGACVTAIARAAGASSVMAVTSGGGYSIIDLAPGRYRVEFSSGCGASGYVTQWWKNASSKAKAALITVAVNKVASGINATLKR